MRPLRPRPDLGHVRCRHEPLVGLGPVDADLTDPDRQAVQVQLDQPRVGSLERAIEGRCLSEPSLAKLGNQRGWGSDRSLRGVVPEVVVVRGKGVRPVGEKGVIAGLLGPRRQVRLQQPPVQFTLGDRREHGPERRRIEIDLVAAEQLEVRANVRRKQRERPSHVPGAVLLLCEARPEEDRERPFLEAWDALRERTHHGPRHGLTAAPQLDPTARPRTQPGELDPTDLDAPLPAL